MATFIEEHLDEFIEKFAKEDGSTPEKWKENAIYHVARRRVEMEASAKHIDDLHELLEGV